MDGPLRVHGQLWPSATGGSREITAIQKKYSKHKTFYKGLQFVLEVTYRRRQEELKNLNLASANFWNCYLKLKYFQYGAIW